MPRQIPVNEPDIDVSTAPIGAHAYPESFGYGQGISALAEGLEKVAGTTAQVGADLNRSKSAAWVGDSIASLGREFADWHADEKNQQSRTISKDFDKFGRDKINTYLKTAPNRPSARVFQDRANDAFLSYYQSAVRHQANLHIEDLTESVQGQTINAASEWRTNYSTMPPVEARKLANDRFAEIMTGIQIAFKGSPQTIREHQARAAYALGLTAGDLDMELATGIANSGKIDEVARQRLLGHLEQVGGAKNRNAISKLNTDIETYEYQYLLNVPTPEIPVSRFVDAYGPEAGPIAYEQFERKRSAKNEALDFMLKVAGKNAASRGEGLDKLIEKGKAPNAGRDAIVAVEASKISSQISGEYVRDWVATANRYHPNIEMADKAIKSAPETDKALRRSEYLSLLEEYQGNAPEGSDPSFYFAVPAQDKMLMTVPEAKGWAEQFALSNPNDFISDPGRLSVFDRFIASFEDPLDPSNTARRSAIAFNNVKQAGNASGMWEAALLNKDGNDMHEIVNAIQGWSEIKKRVNTKWEAALEGDKLWQQFDNAMGREASRQFTVGAFRDTVLAVAARRAPVGEIKEAEMKTYIADATNKVIGRELAFIEYNGHSMMIRKRRTIPGTAEFMRDPADIERIQNASRRIFTDILTVANDVAAMPYMRDIMASVDIRDKARFDWIPRGIDKDAEIRLLSEQVFRQGWLRSTPDGMGATIWMPNSNGAPFELRDTKNRPLEIRFDEYFTTEDITGMPPQLRFAPALEGGPFPSRVFADRFLFRHQEVPSKPAIPAPTQRTQPSGPPLPKPTPKWYEQLPPGIP